MENYTLEQLRELQCVDIRSVDPGRLSDIRDIKVDSSMPLNERIKSYIQQIGNPYCYKCGKYIVKVSYTENGGSINERLESYFRSLV